MHEIAFFVVAGFFSIYTLACGIICGEALIRVFPRLSPNPAKQLGALGPKWEATNVFLALALSTFALFFGSVIDQIGEAILPFLAVSLGSLLVRAVTVIYPSYRRVGLGIKVGNILFVISSFGVPLGLAAAGYYFLSGAVFWQQTAGWVVMSAAIAALAAIGLVPVLKGYGSKQYRLLSSLVYLFALAPIGLAWGNMPYLVYQTITLDEAYGIKSHGELILAGLLLGVLCTGLAFVLPKGKKPTDKTVAQATPSLLSTRGKLKS